MAPAPVELPLPQTSSPGRNSSSESRFSNLRGVQWRIDLGILPGSATASIDELRRVAADSRRRYASLRRRLLVDPHLPKDGNVSLDLVMDNPLSQNPDSMWGRFFRNAELERMVDQDLSRLYPEHGSYFQTSACQAMLRRILLLWCLQHPEYGYRQGMHELLAPLLYVLHIDVQQLCEVRSLYEDYFNDDFDAMFFPEGDLVSNYRFTKAKNWVTGTDSESSIQGSTTNINSLDDLDPETREIFLLSDAYGAEGELGIIVSERFMEHDAYCMFDNLMNGAHGVVAMIDFFSPSPAFGSSLGLPSVIEASSSLYHLLSIVDPSLHSHLVELAVEPQYFALRWLRVLFGREFSLENLLIIWDEIFSSPNGKAIKNDSEYTFRVLSSQRGAFISAMAVSMLLHLRSSLLATEYATACLQRLLNFPENMDVKKLIEKAKSLQALALESNISSLGTQGSSHRNKLTVRRGYSLSSALVSPKPSHNQFPDSYWEEKWRVLHTEEAIHNGSCSNSGSSGTVEVSLGDSFGLCRTESDPSPAMATGAKKDARSSVRRSLLDDLSQGVNPEAALQKSECDRSPSMLGSKGPVSLKVDLEKHLFKEAGDQNTTDRTSDCIEETCLSGENSSVLSTATSSHSMGNDHENDSEKSSVTSNSFIADNDNDELAAHVESCSNISDNPLLQHSEATSVTTSELGASTDVADKQAEALKERKPLSGKFQWFWKFGRGSDEANSGKGSTIGDASKASSSNSPSDARGVSGRTEVGDKKVADTLTNLGQSMLENIQVIESIFQQDRGQSGSLENLSNNILGSKGQAKAMAALKELRKISNLLSEM